MPWRKKKESWNRWFLSCQEQVMDLEHHLYVDAMWNEAMFFTVFRRYTSIDPYPSSTHKLPEPQLKTRKHFMSDVWRGAHWSTVPRQQVDSSTTGAEKADSPKAENVQKHESGAGLTGDKSAIKPPDRSMWSTQEPAAQVRQQSRF